MREGQGHQILARHDPELPSPAGRLPEHLRRGPCPVRSDERRHMVPSMLPVKGRRRVVASNDEHVGTEFRDPRQQGIHLFDGRDLSFEITVMTPGVRVLEVDEVEIVVAPKCRSSMSTLPSFESGTPTTAMPTKLATPRYMGYLATATARRPHRVSNVG